jgi:TRAP-type C4-dicarboxylate transport system permease small subunit
MGNGFRKIIHGISAAGGVIGCLVIVFIVFGTIADVFMRYFFNRPIAGVIEYCTVLLPVMVFFGLALTQKLGGHIATTFLLNRFQPKTRLKQEIGNLMLCSVFVGLMAWEASQGASYSYSIKEFRWGVVGQDISIWWAKIGMAIGLAMFFLQYLADIIGKFGRLRSKEYLGNREREETKTIV